MTSPTTPTHGPKLLDERSIGGILVHLVALPTGIVGAGLVYVVSTNEFTRRNARNALDWHLTMLALTVLMFGSLVTVAELTGQGATELVALPSPANTLLTLVVFGLVLLWMGAGLWSFVVAFVATGKAIFGATWRYPCTPAVVDRISSRVALDEGWAFVITAYALVTPIIIGVALVGPLDGGISLASAFGMIGLIMAATPLTIAAMVIHGERDRPVDAAWQPNVLVYVGVPVGVGAVVYALSTVATDSINPAGDAMYAFLAVFWLSAVVYAGRFRIGER